MLSAVPHRRCASECLDCTEFVERSRKLDSALCTVSAAGVARGGKWVHGAALYRVTGPPVFLLFASIFGFIRFKAQCATPALAKHLRFQKVGPAEKVLP